MRLTLSVLIVMMEVAGFDNEIIISGKVTDDVKVDLMNLAEGRDGLYMQTNTKDGATIVVQELEKGFRHLMYHDGVLKELPIVYNLFNEPFILGASPFDIQKKPVLNVNVKAH